MTILPSCPHCGSTTEEPRPYDMMIMRCQIIADTDWCVFCRKCRLHMHIPGRPVKVAGKKK